MTQVTHWTTFKAPGNKYMIPFHAEMVQEEGRVVVMYRKKRGKDEYETTSVKYDKSYIIEKFKREYLEALDCTWQEFVDLMTDYFLELDISDEEAEDEE